MLISLTGFMGSGKSTVGALLADALGCPLVELDALIAAKAGKSIPQLFADEGEAGFRALEAKLLAETVRRYTTAVISLGGGALGNPASARLIHEKTLCIYLQASVETLRERLAGAEASRPLLAGDWEALLESRRPTYEKTAHVILDTDGLSPEQIADEIIIDCL
jgi:shikimate kinase